MDFYDGHSMNKTALRVLLAAALAACACAYAAPTQLSATAGEIRDIKYASGSGATAVVYAASQGGGVFKSIDSGSTWAKTGLNAGYAWSLAVSPANSAIVYAATEAGLFKTTNSGTSWTQLTFDPARAVAVSPTVAATDTVLLGVPGIGILKSTDSGASWTRSSIGLDSSNVLQIVFQNGTTAYAALDCNSEDLAGTFGDGGWGGIFKTITTGASWTNFNTGGAGATSIGTGSNCVKTIATTPTTVYAGTYNPFNAAGGVYRSTNATGWTSPGGSPDLGNPFGVESLAVDRNSTSNVIYGARSTGVWGSTNGGANYAHKVDPTTGIDPDVHTKIYAIETIAGAANTVLVAARGMGVFKSTAFNTNPVGNPSFWSLSGGITADRVRALDNHATSAPQIYWMALEGAGAMRSTNSGVAGSWSEAILGLDLGAPLGNVDMLQSGYAIAAHPTNTSIAVLGTRGGGLLQWNGSNAWTTSGVSGLYLVGGVDHKPQSAVFSTTGQLYYVLFDAPQGGRAGGLSTGLPSGGNLNLAQTVFPGQITTCTTPVGASASGRKLVVTSNATYLLRYDDLPYRSTNNFASATCVNAPSTGFERLYFHDLAEQPNNTAILVAATNKGIYRSTDSGSNWARLSISGTPTQVFAGLAYISNGILYGVTRAGGLFCSSDNGVAWQSVSLGSLPAVPFRGIKYMNGGIHILTDGGGVYNGFAATCP
jgi:photosystem II stability/assembly factor-like uncharacterized protein